MKEADLDRQESFTFIPNDTYYSRQWYLPKVGAPAAWDTTTGSGVTVAVLDSGIYDEAAVTGPGHPDLAGKVVLRRDFSGSPYGTDDIFGHGTMVAGVIAASANNQRGIAGVAFNSRLLLGKTGDSRPSSSAVAAGIYWAADNGAKVINISSGGAGSCPTFYQAAVDYALARGAITVAAAGNDGTFGAWAPANCRNVIGVGSTDSNDVIYAGSNWGPGVDLVAPGVDIAVTNADGGYEYATGTSFAAPLVSGIAALVWATSWGSSAASVVDRLNATADRISGTGTSVTSGRINAARAVQAAVTRPAPATPLPGLPAYAQSITVTAAELGGGFETYFERGYTLAEKGAEMTNPAPYSNGADLLRSWGYQQGWYRELFRSLNAGTFEIDSAVSLYSSSQGATSAFNSNVSRIPTTSRSVAFGAVGDQSAAFTREVSRATTNGGQIAVSEHVVFIRSGAVSHAFLIYSYLGQFDAALADRAARIQVSRAMALLPSPTPSPAPTQVARPAPATPLPGVPQYAQSIVVSHADFGGAWGTHFERGYTLHEKGAGITDFQPFATGAQLLQSWGYQQGWFRQIHRAVDSGTDLVESQVTVYGSVVGAASAFSHNLQRVPTTYRSSPVPAVGDQSAGFTREITAERVSGGQVPMSEHLILVRSGSVSHLFTIRSYPGQFDAALADRAARIQVSRAMALLPSPTQSPAPTPSPTSTPIPPIRTPTPAPTVSIEQRIADFWKRVDALQPSDYLAAVELGQWALNVTERNPRARTSVADFRSSTAGMQAAIDRAGVVDPSIPNPPNPTVEQRIGDFWKRIDALQPSDHVSAADLGQWAGNVVGRNPRARLTVADFRSSTAGMQAGMDRAGLAPIAATPTPSPSPSAPIPTPTPRTDTSATLISIAPPIGSNVGGTVFTLTGTGFICTPTFPTVTFDTTTATITSCSATSIAGTTPAGPAGAATVKVTNAGAPASNSITFTFTGTPR